MTQEDERFLKRLLATFKIEAQEHLDTLAALALQLERGLPQDEEAAAVETLFREAHSLKGAARAVNLGDVERVCQSLERVLAAMKRRELAPSRVFFEVLERTLDGLTQMLRERVDGDVGVDSIQVGTMMRALDGLLSSPSAPDAARPDAEPAQAPPAAAGATTAASDRPLVAAAGTVRIATTKLDRLLVQAEELQGLKHHHEHLAAELHRLAQVLDEWKRQWAKTVRHARALRRAAAKATNADPMQSAAGGKPRRALHRLLDAIDAEELVVRSFADRLAQTDRDAAKAQRQLGSRVDALLDDMKQALMLPFSTLLEPFPRLVRELARASGKEAELVIAGAALDADRRVLEELKTPLIHLVRNAVDHGIEAPAERVRAGKPARGRVAVHVAPREGNRIELSITDDGAGIAADEVLARARKMGLAARSGAPSTSMAASQLIFESGLSTSALLTDLSGHGLGLAIVREKIERLGGSVSAEPGRDGVGTRFVIVLPATLATFRGLLVRAGERLFVLPSRHVERVGRVPPASIAASANQTVRLADASFLFVALADTLELRMPPRHALPATPPHQQLVVLGAGETRFAFGVDEVLGDQEVLVKPLAPPLVRVRHVAGATVLGPGQVVPLLNVPDLMKSALRLHARGAAAARGAPQPASPRASLLVAEDSITSRELLKQILESAGYRVTTAVDGLDALASLQSGDFDLVISDVEMPRLDGFGLTARLRNDKRLAELPVVLVTALDSREDKERGVAVGANAYIVKRGFERSRLLDTIRALL